MVDGCEQLFETTISSRNWLKRNEVQIDAAARVTKYHVTSQTLKDCSLSKEHWECLKWECSCLCGSRHYVQWGFFSCVQDLSKRKTAVEKLRLPNTLKTLICLAGDRNPLLSSSTTPNYSVENTKTSDQLMTRTHSTTLHHKRKRWLWRKSTGTAKQCLSCPSQIWQTRLNS